MLKDSDIRKLPVPKRDRLLTAGLRDGLYLRVRASGRKTWVIRRRVNGAWHVQTLGDWPDLTALNARRQSSTIETRKATPLTFGEAVEEFHRERIEPKYRSASSKALAYFTRDCADWKGRRLDKITRKDVVELVGAKAADTPNAGQKLLLLLRKFFRWAVLKDYVARNPTADVTAGALEIKLGGPRDRVLSDEELRDLWAIPREPYGRLLRFALLTACRIGEAQQFNRDQITGDVWTIPETKNGKPHAVPLSPTAAALAAAGWPGRNYTTLHEMLEKRGVTWRPHDLRRTAATRMRDAGVSVDVIEAILNHAPPKLIRTYQRPDMVPPMREALATLERVIAEVVE